MANSTALILLAVKGSLFLLVLGVGLRATPRDATYLLRHRALLVHSLLSMNVLMPLLALSLAMLFALHPAIKLALIALAMSPVPPFLPNRAMKAGGEGSYTIGLLATASLAAIVVVPATVWLFGAAFQVPFQMPAHAIAKLVGVGVLLPLGAGIGIRRFAPSLAVRAARPVTLLAMLILVVAIIPILVKVWPAMRSLLGNGTLAAIVVITLAGLTLGHILGGPEPDNRTVLALATACRHPGVAIAIITTTFPEETIAPAAVLLALIVSSIASMPYTVWRKRAINRAPTSSDDKLRRHR